MKSYTNIEQSKKLEEFMPIESADMYYSKYDTIHANTLYGSCDIQYFNFYEYTPCWSLAALIDVLPNEISTGENFANQYQIDIRKYDGEDGTTWYQIAYGNNRGSSSEWHDMINSGEKENIIDCCYQMILKLKEKNLI